MRSVILPAAATILAIVAVSSFRGPAAAKEGDPPNAVEAILREIQQFPPTRPSEVVELKNLQAKDLPKMTKEQLAAYADDGFNPFTAKPDRDALQKGRGPHPIRVSAFEAALKLRETMELRMEEFVPRGEREILDANSKKKFLSAQKDPALAILDLEEALDDLQMQDEKRGMEKSKRWQAHFDLARARLISRLVHIYEYNNLLGEIRRDDLPTLGEEDIGWRLTNSHSLRIGEAKLKLAAKTARNIWAKIEKDYPGTPWAVIAGREKDAPRGLAWTPVKK